MTTIAPFELRGRVEAVLVSRDPATSVSFPARKAQFLRGHGVKGDGHAGVRLADVRERELLGFGLPKGIEVANLREFSAVSVEDLAAIAAAMGVPSIVPGSLGENLVLSGIPRLTELPTGTMLFFQKNDASKRTAVLLVWRENGPCTAPGEAIQAQHPGIPGLAAKFPKAAAGLRGVVGSVYCSGFVHEGDEVIVKVPAQRPYEPPTP
ncbi:MAG TPA: MOSC domain-containing protein [Candidatus Binatia bacterium]|nr:MOSC domain-containing protein [Candidatus Binatia bacterium]